MDLTTPTARAGMPDPALRYGYRSAAAVRWAHVLSSMGVTCDREDEPTCFHLMPHFGDQAGTLYYCGPYGQATWPPCFVVSACALVASGQCHTVVLLGDVAAERPEISLVRRPRPEYWWTRTPFDQEGHLRLSYRRVRRGRYVPVLTSHLGQDTAIGPELQPGLHSGVPCTDAGVEQLLEQARRLDLPEFGGDPLARS